MFVNLMDTVVVAQVATFGDSQVLFSAHLLVAIAPVGPLGHDTLTILLDTVTGHSNAPRSRITVVSLLQVLETKGFHRIDNIPGAVT